MMKKLLLSLFALLFVVTGCSFSDMMNTPTKRVEEFLGKYQTMDSEVLRQLDDTINKDTTMSEDTKKDYKDVMKKQYQNLMYKIKDEMAIMQRFKWKLKYLILIKLHKQRMLISIFTVMNFKKKINRSIMTSLCNIRSNRWKIQKIRSNTHLILHLRRRIASGY